MLSLGGRRTLHQFNDGSVFPPGNNGVDISNLSNVFQDSIISSRELLETEFPKSSFSNIFNKNIKNTQQSKRKQKILKNTEIKRNPFLRRLEKEMIYRAMQINKKYNSVGQMQILYSEPGCEEQAPHIDEEPGGANFISSIFTLNDETVIYLNDKRVVLSSCNLISIHSTTTHNGGENKSSNGNYRIHAYIGPKNTKFVPRNFVGVNDLQCNFCSLKFGSRGKKYYHHTVCVKNVNNSKQKRIEVKMKKRVYNRNYYRNKQKGTQS